MGTLCLHFLHFCNSPQTQASSVLLCYMCLSQEFSLQLTVHHQDCELSRQEQAEEGFTHCSSDLPHRPEGPEKSSMSREICQLCCHSASAAFPFWH